MNYFIPQRVLPVNTGTIIVPITTKSSIYVMTTIREKAAKTLYEADLDINEDISVKQLVDMLEKFGIEMAHEYYRKGVSDTILNKVKPLESDIRS